MLKISNFLFFFFLFFSYSLADDIRGQGANIKIIDKVSTKIFNLTLPLGETFNLIDNEIVVYKCIIMDRKKSNDEIALIKFNSLLNKEKLFFGWIIKSSPSLNSIEDPVYEIKLENCLFDDPLFSKLIEVK